jgi:hypothetical protein
MNFSFHCTYNYVPDPPLEPGGEYGGKDGQDQVVDDGKSRHHCQHHKPEPKEHVDLVQQAGPLAEELMIFEMIFSPTRATSPHVFLGVQEESKGL